PARVPANQRTAPGVTATGRSRERPDRRSAPSATVVSRASSAVRFESPAARALRCAGRRVDRNPALAVDPAHPPWCPSVCFQLRHQRGMGGARTSAAQSPLRRDEREDSVEGHRAWFGCLRSGPRRLYQAAPVGNGSTEGIAALELATVDLPTITDEQLGCGAFGQVRRDERVVLAGIGGD